MAVYAYELATEFSFPNILVYKILKDGVLNGWRMNAAEGYVFYDTNDNYTEPAVDENGDYVYDENGNIVEVPVIYYYTIAYLPLNFNFATFPWVAVPRDSVDENYIFSDGGNNDHEVMGGDNPPTETI